jgi:hypothetical protein
MKKMICLTLGALLLASAVSLGSVVASESPVTEEWIAPDNTVSAWYSEDTPETSVGVDIDSTTLHVGKTAGGKDIFALLRLPLRGTWLANELQGARLFLKLKEGKTPATLWVGLAAQAWGFSQTPRTAAKALVNEQSLQRLETRAEEGDWISLDVTGFVKAWLNCDVPNYGFALFGESSGEEAVFFADDGDDSHDFPYLVASGAVGGRALTYGKFGYTEQPVAGAKIDQGGNCMSYALRDTARARAFTFQGGKNMVK